MNKNFYEGYFLLENLQDFEDFFEKLQELYSSMFSLFPIDLVVVQTYDNKKQEKQEFMLLDKNSKENTNNNISFLYVLDNNIEVKLLIYSSNEEILVEDMYKELEFLHRLLLNLYNLKKNEYRIQDLNFRDALTYAYNTSGFMNYGVKLKRKNLLHNYACLFLNLKNFKYINESIGSKCADILLKNYAQSLISLINNQGIVCRLGGDNFSILVKKDILEDYLDNIKNIKLQSPINVSKYFEMNSRIGVYLIKENDIINQALEQSSIACNIAKSKKIDEPFYCNEELVNIFMENKRILADFKEAIENNEFIVVYQPKVSTKDFSLCGAEALVRWKHNGSFIPVYKFISALEKDMSICTLDMYVLNIVCKDIRNWLDKGYEPSKISINFSKKHFQNSNFANEIIETIFKYNIDTKYIEIELTETLDCASNETISNFMDCMHKHNICVSMDDFGAGYSSLNLLRELNFDVIKLDKSFIDNILNDESKDKILVRNMISMINELGMTIVAEGVESKEQVDFLQKINCDVIQGYYFDKPLFVEDFEKKLSK